MAAADNLFPLPPNLPVPVDDGACDHLTGMTMPDIALASTAGRSVTLADEPGTSVVFAYPRTGEPGTSVPGAWDAIPGARGCTPEACGFRDLQAEFLDLSATIYGLSTQTTEYQTELVERLHLPYEVLSDADLRLTHALHLPVFEFDGMTLVKRLTFVMDRGVIRHVFYPVFPTDTHADQVARWLRHERTTISR